MKAVIRLLRPHQWAKNGLLLLPAVAAHLSPEGPRVLALAAGFVSFCLLASSLYVLNDLADLEFDRAHPTKRSRPLASGQVAPSVGLTVMGLSATLSLLLALSLPSGFMAAWAVYLVLAGSYSFVWKRIVVLDVVTLAALYTVRVVAGAAAVSVPLSRWFLAFSVFLFASLALLKRLVEVRGVAGREEVEIRGRGWRVADLPLLMSLGVGSSIASALVYCLYITDAQATTLYAHPDMLWAGLPIFLYWVARLWLLAGRGDVHDDPVVFALRDVPSYAVLALLFAMVVMAS